ncbi:MAG: hypothetical protein H6728_10735 [Myxococcales bacterium]|nr:hypothetical protein [Myxococcales bacterium]MCB9643535.1 hypothetical protein [Myxococcales bacterium]
MSSEKKDLSQAPIAEGTTNIVPDQNKKLTQREVFGTLSMDVLQLTQAFPPKERRPTPSSTQNANLSQAAEETDLNKPLTQRELFGTLSMDVLQLKEPIRPRFMTEEKKEEAPPVEKATPPTANHKKPIKTAPSNRLPLFLAGFFVLLSVAAALFWFREKLF